VKGRHKTLIIILKNVEIVHRTVTNRKWKHVLCDIYEIKLSYMVLMKCALTSKTNTTTITEFKLNYVGWSHIKMLSACANIMTHILKSKGPI
jgi:hypothetical protein